MSAPLCGPVQTSYRAELRAILHVVRTAIDPVVVMCDCKSVVDTYNNAARGDMVDPKKLNDDDLWKQIFELKDPTIVKVQWMPSHLNDEGYEDKKKAALRQGKVTERDIQCNDFVDKLAKEGAAKHAPIGKIVLAAADRRICTVVTLKMLLHIWEHHL